MARKKLGEILVEAGVLDPASLRAALVEQRRWGGQLGRILVDMKLVTEETLVQAISHQLNFPTVDLDNAQVSEEVLALVPAELADHHAIIPFNREGKFLDVAMSDPTNLGIIDELRIRTQLNVRSYLAGPNMIERALARLYRRGPGSVTGARQAQHGSGVLGFDRSGRLRLTVAADEQAGHFGQQPKTERDVEIRALQERLSTLEAQVSRDEDVLRKVLGLLVEKGVATRDEILDRIK